MDVQHHSVAPSVKALCEELIGLCLESMKSRDRWHRLEVTTRALDLAGLLTKALVESRRRQIAGLAAEQHPMKRIARVAHCSPSHVSKVAREAGVPPRALRDTSDPEVHHLAHVG